MGISAKSSGADVGDIKANANAAIPAGWLACGGQAVSRSTYAALFLAIGTLYGAGNGSTTFNVPDLRGRALFGKDNMGGSAANRLTSEWRLGWRDAGCSRWRRKCNVNKWRIA